MKNAFCYDCCRLILEHTRVLKVKCFATFDMENDANTHFHVSACLSIKNKFFYCIIAISAFSEICDNTKCFEIHLLCPYCISYKILPSVLVLVFSISAIYKHFYDCDLVIRLLIFYTDARHCYDYTAANYV